MAAAQTRTARLERLDEGTVVIRIAAEVDQSVEDAVANIASAKELHPGVCPVLIDLRVARPLAAETRHFYSGQKLTEAFSAMGLLVPTGAFGRMFGNVYLRVARPGIPARLFGDEAEARAWLRGFVR